MSDPAFDYVVVVSGLTSGIQSAPRRLEAYVADAAAKGVRVVGICTGGIVMARAGIMKGRPCCVSSFHVSDLENLETEARPVYDRIFVDDGDRITCAGGVAPGEPCHVLGPRRSLDLGTIQRSTVFFGDETSLGLARALCSTPLGAVDTHFIFETGDAYYVPPGHTPVLYAGTEVVEFSPTEQLQQTLAVVTKNMEAAG